MQALRQSVNLLWNKLGTVFGSTLARLADPFRSVKALGTTEHE